jgi:hypothetical protein
MAIQQQPVVPAAFSGDALDLARSQRLAQLLSNQQMPEGQMISGRFVAPSWTQQLAGLVNAGTGAYFANKSEKQQQALAEKLRTGETQALADFMKTKQGTPAEMFAAQAGPMADGGNIPIQQSRAAVAPNPQAAFANLYQDPRSPQRLRDLAFTKMMADPEAFTLTEGAKRFITMPDGTVKEVAAGADKQSPEYKNYLIAKNDPINPFKGGFTDYQTMLKKAGASNVSVSTGQKGFDNTLKLRGDFRSEPVYKGFQEIESAFSQINAGLNAKSPAGDLAAATKFMKLLDPTSVVRESELSMAMQATGALDRLYNYANLVATGQKLTPTQREDFRKLGNEFYTTSYNQYNTKREEYSDIAKRNDLNVDDVVGKQPKAPAVILPPVFAINQSTGERIQSTDGGNTWKSAPKGK